MGRTPRKAGFPSLNKNKGEITTFTLLSRTMPGNQLHLESKTRLSYDRTYKQPDTHGFYLIYRL